MSIYALSDFHLSFGVGDKPMNVFGDRWNDYEKKIKENWNNEVKDGDTVIIAGDFSWATYLEDSLADFEFLNGLKGNKIILKGNHDYWWTTLNKLNQFIETNNIKNVKFLHNNFYEVGDYMICGTRFWSYDEETLDNNKIFNRELERAKISLEAAKKADSNKNIIFVTHYPPSENIINLVKMYNVKYWIYGHIHSNYEESLVKIDGIETYLTSGDYLEFKPLKICE